ncbi:MAG TPA: OmpA family protein [Kofleriaceae bacterium]|nr:OmpA family protein [Kofleriaceae bacterium]
MNFRTYLSVVFVGGLLATGCPKPPPPVPYVAPAPAPAAEPAPADDPAEEPAVTEEPKDLEVQKDVIRLKPGIKILFASDSDQLDGQSFPILDEVVAVMQQSDRIRIRVEGHTDNVGGTKHNQDLSTRRAASVLSYLAGKGIASDRLESTGCGEGTPVADNATEDGRQQNRRVEFVILHHHRTVEPCRIYHSRDWHGHHDHGDAGGASGDGSDGSDGSDGGTGSAPTTP